MSNILYVSRDTDHSKSLDSIDIWRDRPKRIKDYDDSGNICFDSVTCERTCLSLDDFNKIFGYTPRKGRCSCVMPIMKKV